MGESSLATALAISESCTAEMAACSAASLFVLAWAVLEKHRDRGEVRHELIKRHKEVSVARVDVG